MSEITIITKSILNEQSRKWVLKKSQITKIGLFKNMFDDNVDITEIYIDSVYDDIFVYIYKMLLLDSDKVNKYIGILNSSCGIKLLYKLFQICDYLNISSIQTEISNYIALNINSMSLNELKNIVTIFDD